MIDLKYSRENDRVVAPQKREGDAGYDLFIDPVWFDEKHNSFLRIKPQETVMLSTGIRTEIPSDYYIQIQERGSTGTKAMKYGAGVIDSNFTGIHNVVITNCGSKDIIIYDDRMCAEQEDAIFYSMFKAVAQFVLLPVPKTNVVEVSVDTIINRESERGENMLGSTNK